MNFALSLAESSARFPARPALVDLDAPGGVRRFGYGDLARHVGRTASGLRDLGLRPGERVALLLGNSWEYVVCFLAIGAARLVAVPLNTRLLEGELLHMLRDSGSRLLVAQDGLLKGKEVLAETPELGCVVVRSTSPLRAGQITFEELPRAPPIEPADVPGDELFSLMYTSGTTGLPKAVALSHHSWNIVASIARKYLDYAPTEVTLHVAPLTHGSGFLLMPTFISGGVNVLCAKFDAARTLELFRTERITNGFFVPAMVRMLLDEPQPHGSTHGALRTIYYAGSPIEPETLQGALHRFGDVLVQSFGQMESPMFVTVLDRSDHQRIRSGEAPHLIRSAGRPIEGVRVRIVDEQDRELPAGEAGEIVTMAPQMMSGYWNRPDTTAETMRGGWLHTGDIGRFDTDGYLYIVDRKKDMIISGGANIYAREVEEVLLGNEAVSEAAVIGLPHPKWGEIVTAVLVSKNGAPVDDEAMSEFCRRRLADYRRPKRFIWIEKLPRNAYGKVLKRELRKDFAPNKGEPA